MTKEEAEKLIDETVEFVLSNYEVVNGKIRPFTIVDVDPETWWSKVQLIPHQPEKLYPKSKTHFECRLSRWKELAREKLLHTYSKE